jgi:nucleotide-binding universal stress UspA family protein
MLGFNNAQLVILAGESEMFCRILVPLDGSETAENVLPFVKEEARCHQATVVLMRVIAPLRSSLMMVPALVEQANKQTNKITKRYLEDIADDLRAEGLEVEVTIEQGPPAQKIIEFAEKSGCDLIMIGTRGETGALQWRFGGVAGKVVRAKTTMPVLVVTT